MNWEMAGVVAEVIGAIAVVTTLIFLAVEIRKNTVATRQQSYNDFVNRQSDWLESFSYDRERMSVFSAGLSGEKLDHIDSQRFMVNMMKIMNHMQDVYLQYEAGVAEEKIWIAQSRFLGALLSQSAFQNWWQESTQYYLPEFIAAVSMIEPLNPVTYDQETGKWGRPGGNYDGNKT
jgi:hypothetical protein